MDKASNARRIAWILFAVGLVGVLGALLPRLKAEKQNKSIDLAIDYDNYSDLFRNQGVDEDKGFDDLKARGAATVAFDELTLDRLTTLGHLKCYNGSDFARSYGDEHLQEAPIDKQHLYLVCYDDPTFKDLQTYLGIFMGRDRLWEWDQGKNRTDGAASSANPRVLEVISTERFLTVTQQGLGFSDDLVQHFKDRGYRIMLRPENKVGATPEMAKEYFAHLPKADVIVFGGIRNDAFGYPDTRAMDTTIKSMEAATLLFGAVEVPTPKNELRGQPYLTRKMWYDALHGHPYLPERVQSIPVSMLVKMTPDDAIEMFLLGVRERNIRALYLRPFGDPVVGETLLQTNQNYIADLTNTLKQSGFTTEGAVPFPTLRVRGWAAALLNLAAGASLSLLLVYFLPSAPLPWVMAPALLVMFGGIAASLTHHDQLWCKISGLAAALAMPTLAMMMIVDGMESLGVARSRARALQNGVIWLVRASVVSLLGGLIVASIFAYTPFMLEFDQVRAIKLLMVVPPLLTLGYAALRHGKGLATAVRDILATPMTFGHALVMLFVLGGVVFYIMRTGNTPEAGSSDTERIVRNMLQNIFIARPRFKDFLIGSPAAVILGMVCSRGTQAGRLLVTRPWLVLLLGMMAIGQADIVDTFCHVHTPFLISLLRVFNGLWLGAIIGGVVGLAFWRPPSSTPQPPVPAPQQQPVSATV
ncbi:MAG: DUF5693 family protein [Candidatus Xenobia bacterium]